MNLQPGQAVHVTAVGVSTLGGIRDVIIESADWNSLEWVDTWEVGSGEVIHPHRSRQPRRIGPRLITQLRQGLWRAKLYVTFTPFTMSI